MTFDVNVKQSRLPLKRECPFFRPLCPFSCSHVGLLTNSLIDENGVLDRENLF